MGWCRVVAQLRTMMLLRSGSYLNEVKKYSEPVSSKSRVNCGCGCGCEEVVAIVCFSSDN
jgi:hypothetical protein